MIMGLLKKKLYSFYSSAIPIFPLRVRVLLFKIIVFLKYRILSHSISEFPIKWLSQLASDFKYNIPFDFRKVIDISRVFEIPKDFQIVMYSEFGYVLGRKNISGDIDGFIIRLFNHTSGFNGPLVAFDGNKFTQDFDGDIYSGNFMIICLFSLEFHQLVFGLSDSLLKMHAWGIPIISEKTLKKQDYYLFSFFYKVSIAKMFSQIKFNQNISMDNHFVIKILDLAIQYFAYSEIFYDKSGILKLFPFSFIYNAINSMFEGLSAVFDIFPIFPKSFIDFIDELTENHAFHPALKIFMNVLSYIGFEISEDSSMEYIVISDTIYDSIASLSNAKFYFYNSEDAQLFVNELWELLKNIGFKNDFQEIDGEDPFMPDHEIYLTKIVGYLTPKMSFSIFSKIIEDIAHVSLIKKIILYLKTKYALIRFYHQISSEYPVYSNFANKILIANSMVNPLFKNFFEKWGVPENKSPLYSLSSHLIIYSRSLFVPGSLLDILLCAFTNFVFAEEICLSLD